MNMDIDDGVLLPYTYLKNNTSGKGFRNKLLDYFNLFYKVDDNKLEIIKEFIDILHTSSLIIDDIEDNGEFRRGKLCAHKIYGIGSTINAGNLMYFKAWELLMKLESDNNNNNNNGNELNKIFVNSMIKLHIGQGKEIYWRNNKICPSEEEYLEMVIGKTSELFKLCVLILSCISDDDTRDKDNIDEKLIKFSEKLGIIYQIRNDIKDIRDDYKNGNYSYPIIYCIREKCMKMESNDKEIEDKIRELGGIRHSEEKIISLMGEKGSREFENENKFENDFFQLLM